MGGLPIPTLVVYWTYARFVAGTVVGPLAVKLFKNAARARSASGDPLRYAPVRCNFVSGMVITGEAAEAEVAKRATESATNDLMLRGGDGRYVAHAEHL